MFVVELDNVGDTVVTLTGFADIEGRLLGIGFVIDGDSLGAPETFRGAPLAVVGAVVLARLSMDAPPGSFVDEAWDALGTEFELFALAALFLGFAAALLVGVKSWIHLS